MTPDRSKPCPDGCGGTCYRYAERCVDCHKARRKANALGRGGAAQQPEGVTVETSPAGAVAIRAVTHISDVPTLLRETKVDLSKYTITKQTVRSYQSPNKEGTRQLYALAVDLKPIVPTAMWDALEGAAASLSVYRAKPIKKRKRKPRRFAAEWCPFDHHFGNLSWAEETGEDYDLHIAARRFREASHDAVAKATRTWEIDHWVIPVGQDFFHVDNPSLLTTSLKQKNPPLEVEGRWPKMFEVGTQCMADAIDMMREVAPVRLLWVPGNHDRMTSWWLAYLLEQRYRDCPEVTVDRSPSPRKFWEFGSVLIGFTHGNEEKHARLPSIIASHDRQAWARTSTHEWHIGHYHHKQVIDHDGVMVRVLPSMSGADAWHHYQGFGQAKKCAEMFIWDAELGLEAQITTRYREDAA